MKTVRLMENWKFENDNAVAEPLFAGREGRVLRFALRPGQSIEEHASSSPVYIVVLKGRGMFAGGDGNEQQVNQNEMVILDPGEKHRIHAQDEDLVFLTFMQGVPESYRT